MSKTRDSIFKALADGHRRAIVAALCSRPWPAGELARLVGLAPNALSFHLRWLRSVGLVSVRREGRWLWYSVQAQSLKSWLDSLGASFQITESAARMSMDSEETAGSDVEVGLAGRERATRRSRIPTKRAGGRPRGRVGAERSPNRVGDNVATDTLPDELL